MKLWNVLFLFILVLALISCPADESADKNRSVNNGDSNNVQLQTVATPTASPTAGTYTTAKTVTLTSATAGADIRYTTNGKDPTATSIRYTKPIAVNATRTIKAIAVKDGMNNSGILTAVYTINPIKMTVSFALGYTTNRTPPENIIVDAGKSAGERFPETPSRPTWDFTGWKDSSGKVYTSDTIINDNVALTASWNFVPGATNPLIKEDRFTADPAAFLDDDGTVYLICGEDELPPNAPSNEYFRITQWNIFSTTDMKNFKWEKVLMKSNDFTYGQVNSAWASQAIKGLDGRYYFYGTVLWNGSGYEQIVSVASSDSPLGPWKQVGTAPMFRATTVTQDTGNSQTNIDPTVLIDGDGTAWLAWSQQRPRIAKLNSTVNSPNYMTAIERPIKLLFPSSWTTEDRYEEGPYLYQRTNGRDEMCYYLFYASMRLDSSGKEVAETISYAMAVDREGTGLGGLSARKACGATACQ